MRIGFLYKFDNGWVGGKNYFFSVLRALDTELTLANERSQIFVFCSTLIDSADFDAFNNVVVVKTALLNHGFWSVIDRVLNKTVFENALFYLILKKFRIDVLSHSYLPGWSSIKSLPWIPDFQHCYLPEYFNRRQLRKRNKIFRKYLSSKNVLYSSNSAKLDSKKFYDCTSRGLVYRFNPLPLPSSSNEEIDNVINKFSIHSPYVFLPNQFWMHKNHDLVFKACRKALGRGSPFVLVCTGLMEDNRSNSYVEGLLADIKDNGLDSYIYLLGLVDRDDWNCLIQGSEVVINPSRFEGWSTVVEESKYINKKIALSDIPVHREQLEFYNEGSYEFFDTDDVDGCLEAIQRLINRPVPDDSFAVEQDSILAVLRSL